MRRIRQHGPDGKLFDMDAFIPDVLQFRDVSHWHADIERAIGRNGERSNDADSNPLRPRKYTTKGLTTLYRDLYQTIDGTITAFNGDVEVARLTAVDSSYWEIVSTNSDFEEMMEEKYGVYISPFD